MMHTREATRHTTAAPAAIWQRWTTPELWPEHNPDLRAARLEGALAVGARIVIEPFRGPRSTLEVIAVDSERRFTTTGRLPGCRLTVDHEMQSDATGTTFTHRLSMEGPTAPLFWRLFGRKLANALPSMVDTIARLSERAA